MCWAAEKWEKNHFTVRTELTRALTMCVLGFFKKGKNHFTVRTELTTEYVCAGLLKKNHFIARTELTTEYVCAGLL